VDVCLEYWKWGIEQNLGRGVIGKRLRGLKGGGIDTGVVDFEYGKWVEVYGGVR